MQIPMKQQGSMFLNPGVLKGFNPQPEPPGDRSGKLDPGSLVGFNPQPDPPGEPNQALLNKQKS